MEVEVVFEVSDLDIKQIEDFMKAEYMAAGGQGFYGAWKSIVPKLKVDSCIVGRVNGEAVAFLTYSSGELIADIEYLVVAQVYWNKGAGKKLVAAFEAFARAQWLLVLQLLATNELNRKKWKAMGFLDTIKLHSGGGPKLYKTLVEVAMPTKLLSLSECKGKYVALWTEETHLEPNAHLLIWSLDEEKNKQLRYPIINPCFGDWKMNYWLSELQMKAKNFKTSTRFDSDFLIVCELPS